MNKPSLSTHRGLHHQTVRATNVPSHYPELDFEPESTGCLHLYHGFTIYDANSRTLLESIALNPNTPTSILRELASHPQAEIRAVLAENQNTPIETIWQLAHDENPDVRYQLAENHHLAVELLSKLAEDDNPYVACRAQSTIRRVEEALAAKRIGWSMFGRAQSFKEVTEIYASTINFIRHLFSSISGYARAI